MYRSSYPVHQLKPFTRLNKQRCDINVVCCFCKKWDFYIFDITYIIERCKCPFLFSVMLYFMGSISFLDTICNFNVSSKKEKLQYDASWRPLFSTNHESPLHVLFWRKLLGCLGLVRTTWRHRELHCGFFFFFFISAVSFTLKATQKTTFFSRSLMWCYERDVGGKSHHR